MSEAAIENRPTGPARLWGRIAQRPMVRDAGWAMAGQATSYAAQVAYFILLARILGVEQYGVFAGATAFASLVTPFCGMGAGMLFMRHAGGRPEERQRYWGNILASTAIASSGLILLLCLISPHFLNAASAAVVLPIGLANCFLGQLIQGIVQSFQSTNKMHLAAAWNTAMNALRLVAAILLAVAAGRASALEWAWVSLALSVIVAGVAIATMCLHFGRPVFEPRLWASRAREGLVFSVSGSTASAYNDLDKTLLSHFGMNIANGIYTTAYRVVDFATVPVSSVEWASIPRFFDRQRSCGTRHLETMVARTRRHAAIIGLACGAAAFLLAPLIGAVLGKSFATSVGALRWLCLLPAFRAIHQISGAGLTGSGHQGYRTAAQAVAALLNLALNLAWIPRFGWKGAAWASLATDGLLAVICWLALWALARAANGNSVPSVGTGGAE